ncbi:MAG: DUF1501 domain-containing protein [Verrucomicrobiota bacterium]
MNGPICSRPLSTPLSRRNFLYGTGASLGSVAFSSLLASEAKNPLSPKPPLIKPRAKAVIMLFMEGGPSHIETFDPKPKLKDLHMKKFMRNDDKFGMQGNGERFYVQSPYDYVRAGQSGIPMCEHFQHLSQPDVADELCVYRGCQAESVNHSTALYHMNTGNRFGGDPAIGSWVTYGLGSENQNLPGYVVMTELAQPQGGSSNWSNGFLPAYYQGTTLRSEGSPILDLNAPAWKTRQHQRANLDVLRKLNQTHLQHHPEHDDLAARIENYELAYRMQMTVPDIIDLSKESQSTREAYGLDNKATEAFGRKCLLARRLVEQGTRFIQIFSGGWDSHDFIERAHKNRIQSVDKPIAALIRDLKQRGMLDDTLVVFTGEFGRTPDNTKRGGEEALGRDHNNKAMSMFFAGGGVNAGSVVGATDETGLEAVDTVHPIRDVHVTMLHLLGLDDSKLTYFHGGRYKQLSQFGGKVIPQLLA